MFEVAHMAAISISAASEANNENSLKLLSQALPATYTLRQLYEDVSNEYAGENNKLESIHVLHSCLDETNYKRLLPEASDAEYINKLAVWLSRSILPDDSIITNDEAPENDSSANRGKAIRQVKIASNLGLNVICRLLELQPVDKLDQRILLSILAFTDPRDPWTTPASAEIAGKLTERFQSQLAPSGFIVEFILKDFVRPLFSKSKPQSITTQGRKAMFRTGPRKQLEIADIDPANKPWKYKDVYAVTVFQWALEHINDEIISQSWPLFVPPVLTLLDDPNTEIRIRGLEILTAFLHKLTWRLLLRTGLGEVFEDAVMPTLLYLPSLTPVDESVRLLKPAYEALYTLADKRFPAKEAYTENMRFMDRIIRHGVLQGYSHSHEYPQIVEVLLQEMDALINKMGIHSVKHLKDILPIISTVLTYPFAASRPLLLQSAVKALKTTILNSWPRIAVHRMEIIKALALSWSVIEEIHDPNILGLKQELEITGKLLVKSVEGELNIANEVQPLIYTDPSLAELFGTATKPQQLMA